MRLRAGQKALLAGARLFLPPEGEDGLSECVLNGDIDWSELVDAADWHRTAPLLWHNLDKNGLTGHLPSKASSELRSAYLETGARNLFIRAELYRVLASLNQRGIEAMLLKGSALVHSVFSDAGLRPMRDVDLLVRTEHVADADDVLATCGYVEAGRDAGAEVLPRRTLTAAHGLFAFDVHDRLGPAGKPLGFDLEQMWDRSRHFEIGGATCRMPATEDLLVHVALHFVRHQFYDSQAALGRLADVSAILDSGVDIDFERVVGESRVHRSGPQLALALLLARDLMGWDPPFDLEDLDPTGLAVSLVEAFVTRRVLVDRRRREFERRGLSFTRWDTVSPPDPVQVWRTAATGDRMTTLSSVYASWFKAVGPYVVAPGEIRAERAFLAGVQTLRSEA